MTLKYNFQEGNQSWDTASGGRYLQDRLVRLKFIVFGSNRLTLACCKISQSLLSLPYHSEGCEWHTFKDWIKEDIRQILIETHELPFQNQVHKPILASCDGGDRLL
jgi:hypothetical protein